MTFFVNETVAANLLTKDAVNTMCKHYEDDVILPNRLILQLTLVKRLPNQDTNSYHVSQYILFIYTYIYIYIYTYMEMF